MTGFTGFENLSRPLYSPLPFFPPHPFLSPFFAVKIMKGQIKGHGWGGGSGGGSRLRERVIAVTPESALRMSRGGKKDEL